MAFFDKLLNGLSNASYTVEKLRQERVKKSIPADTCKFYSAKASDSVKKFQDKHQFFKTIQYHNLGGPYYLLWYESHGEHHILWLNIEYSFRIGNLRAIQRKLHYRRIRSFIGEIPIEGEMKLLTYDQYLEKVDDLDTYPGIESML
jgi:hypothetical protein